MEHWRASSPSALTSPKQTWVTFFFVAGARARVIVPLVDILPVVHGILLVIGDSLGIFSGGLLGVASNNIEPALRAKVDYNLGLPGGKATNYETSKLVLRITKKHANWKYGASGDVRDWISDPSNQSNHGHNGDGQEHPRHDRDGQRHLMVMQKRWLAARQGKIAGM